MDLTITLRSRGVIDKIYLFSSKNSGSRFSIFYTKINNNTLSNLKSKYDLLENYIGLKNLNFLNFLNLLCKFNIYCFS